MFNVPFNYRHSELGGGPGSVFPGELSARICGANQVIWMTARRDTLSGATGDIYPPCSGCVSNWKDQSAYGNNGTLLNSAELSGDTGYWPDYWTGDTTNNNQPFISFDFESDNPNKKNALNVPSDPTFANLTEFTFTTIFRVRQIEPNSRTGLGAVSQSSLVENAEQNAGARSDGWGIDALGSPTNEIRCWFYTTGFQLNQSIITLPSVNDWDDWMRLTVRVSGDTIEANVFNENALIGNSGFTWVAGDRNGNGDGIRYNITNNNWWIAARENSDFPGVGPDNTTSNGSWDISEYALYNSWLSDSCVNAIWNYYDFRYGIANL